MKELFLRLKTIFLKKKPKFENYFLYLKKIEM